MYAAELEAIIRRVMEGQATAQWQSLMLLILVAAVFSAVAAFLGAYFKSKGEIAAKAADLSKILHELQATTNVVQQIKQEIEFGDWRRRESLRTRREKLEDLLISAYELDRYSDKHREAVVFGSGTYGESSGIGKIKCLQSLYFPGLEGEVAELEASCSIMFQSHIAVFQDRLNRVPAGQSDWGNVVPNRGLVDKTHEAAARFHKSLHSLRSSSAVIMSTLLEEALKSGYPDATA